MLRLDAVLFEQVLFNLLDNAAKYSPAGRPDRVSAPRRDGGLVEIEVVDEGPGIPAADLERIFDKFYRVPGAGPPARRHRARPGDLPRLCRGAWADRSRPRNRARPLGRGVDDPHAGRAGRPLAGCEPVMAHG